MPPCKDGVPLEIRARATRRRLPRSPSIRAGRERRLRHGCVRARACLRVRPAGVRTAGVPLGPRCVRGRNGMPLGILRSYGAQQHDFRQRYGSYIGEFMTLWNMLWIRSSTGLALAFSRLSQAAATSLNSLSIRSFSAASCLRASSATSCSASCLRASSAASFSHASTAPLIARSTFIFSHAAPRGLTSKDGGSGVLTFLFRICRSSILFERLSECSYLHADYLMQCRIRDKSNKRMRTDLLDDQTSAEVSSRDDDLAPAMLLGQVELEDAEAVDYFDVRHVERMVAMHGERGFMWPRHRVPREGMGLLYATWRSLGLRDFTGFTGKLRDLRENAIYLAIVLQCIYGKMQSNAISCNRLRDFTGKCLREKGPRGFFLDSRKSRYR